MNPTLTSTCKIRDVFNVEAEGKRGIYVCIVYTPATTPQAPVRACVLVSDGLLVHTHALTLVCVCVCLCACVRARARVCSRVLVFVSVFLCTQVRAHDPSHWRRDKPETSLSAAGT